MADASLFLAPLVFEHGWAWDDWDRLAAGVTIGHLLECSAQVTGGNYSGAWWEHGDFTEPGFPIAECAADGSAVITKPDGTGGLVSFDTVREQLMYEVHDPSAYLNPDVTADFTSVRLTDLGDDRVRVGRSGGARRPGDLQGPRVHARPDGRVRRRSHTDGPTPKRRRGPRRGSSVGAPSSGAWRSRSGTRSTSG